MKTLNIHYTEKEFRAMRKAKKLYSLRVKSNLSWERFVFLSTLSELTREEKYGV
jgi:hypothetical protein